MEIVDNEDVPHYQYTLLVHPCLPMTPKEVISKTMYAHPWFKGKVTRIVFEDHFGRVWNKTTGRIKEGIPLQRCGLKYVWIAMLGGMSWTSYDEKNFKCEFRTSRQEFKRAGASPETFTG